MKLVRQEKRITGFQKFTDYDKHHPEKVARSRTFRNENDFEVEFVKAPKCKSGGFYTRTSFDVKGITFERVRLKYTNREEHDGRDNSVGHGRLRALVIYKRGNKKTQLKSFTVYKDDATYMRRGYAKYGDFPGKDTIIQVILKVKELAKEVDFFDYVFEV